jgi:hypothetical protein
VDGFLSFLKEHAANPITTVAGGKKSKKSKKSSDEL